MKLTESTKWSWVWGALDANLKAELLAGKHTEYRGLQQLWRDELAKEMEAVALRQACFEVASDTDRNWLEN